MKTHGGLLLRLLGLVGVSAFLVSAFTPLPNLLARWGSVPSEPGPAQAIVVLGGGLQPDAVLTASSLLRTLHGITLHRKGLAPLLVFSGAARGGGRSEAEVRAELARELGVSPRVILTEKEARTTREEALRMSALLRPKGVQRILLVTGSRHMARAQELFVKAGFDVLAAPADEIPRRSFKPEDGLKLMREMLEEIVARFYYRVAGYL